MAPIRRYLRITKYSVLETRIYLDNPALAYSWLLNPRDPVLPRVIESVRPLVLPKLREEKERERTKKKSSKKKAIKDTVTTEEFEVSIFLPETNTRHSLLYKHKHFRDKTQTKLTSNSSKLTGTSRDAPIDVEGKEALYGGSDPIPLIRPEETDENDVIDLDNIPTLAQDEADAAFGGDDTELEVISARRSKRRRSEGQPIGGEIGDSDQDGDDGEFDIDDIHTGLTDDENEGSDEDDMFVDQRPSKRRREGEAELEAEPEPEPEPVVGVRGDDKKKMAMDISYEGFAIYGRVLCLVVKRRGGGIKSAASNRSQTASQLGGQAMMENWITSTQMPLADGAEGADDGEAGSS